MAKTRFLSVKSEIHVELALGAIAALSTLDRVVEYMRDAHGITTTPAILEAVQRRERNRFDEIRTELAPRLEQRLTGDLLDNAAYATEIEHKAIERTEAMLARGEIREPSRVARDLADVKAKSIDKRALIQGKPTQIVEKRSINEIIAQLKAMGVLVDTDDEGVAVEGSAPALPPAEQTSD